MSMLMFISMLDKILAIVEFVIDMEERECLFATSRTGAIIQDGDKRERSDRLS